MADGVSLSGRLGGARPALVWAGFLVTGVFGYLAVKDVRFGEVWEGLESSNYWWLVPSLAVLAVGIWLRAIRWRFLFTPRTRPSGKAIVRALLIGYFFNNVLPARAGEAARIVVLKQEERVPRVEAAATVVIERAYDVLSLLLLLFVTLPWLPAVSWLRAAAVLGIVLALVVAAAILVLALHGERPLRVLLRPLARLPLVTEERIGWAVHNLGAGLAGIRDARLAVAAFLLTTASWLVLAFSTWLVMLAFDLELSFLAGLLVIIAINLAMILPSAPAAVGVFEVAALVALGAYGISESQALSYAVVLHAVNFVPYVLVGMFVLHRHATLVRSRRRPAPRVSG